MAEIRAELELARAEAQQLARESLSENTRRLYESDWRGFLAWVQRTQEANPALSALPATDYTLALYVGAHVEMKPSTMARRLAAIRLMHLWSGHGAPFDSASSFNAVYSGYKRRWAHVRPAVPPQAAATESIIRLLVDEQESGSLIGLRNRALLLVGFDAALRRSELVGLDVEHVSTHQEGLELFLPSSKSDHEGQGNAVLILARSDSPYCPVRALVSWLDAASISDGAIFRRLHRRGNALHLGEERLSDKAVYRLVKGAAASAGAPGRFGAHSLRRGLITSSLRENENVSSVQDHARHKNIATTSRYNERAKSFSTHPGKKLLRS